MALRTLEVDFGQWTGVIVLSDLAAELQLCILYWLRVSILANQAVRHCGVMSHPPSSTIYPPGAFESAPYTWVWLLSPQLQKLHPPTYSIMIVQPPSPCARMLSILDGRMNIVVSRIQQLLRYIAM